MAEAAMMMCGIDPAPKLPKRAREKAVYKMVNPEIIPATSLLDIPAHVGKFVAMGFMLHADGDIKVVMPKDIISFRKFV